MEILRICLEEQLLIKNYVIKHLMLLKIQNMMDINADFLQWFTDTLIKKPSGGAAKNKIMSNQELPEELHKPFVLLDNRRIAQTSYQNIWKKTYTHLL